MGRGLDVEDQQFVFSMPNAHARRLRRVQPALRYGEKIFHHMVRVAVPGKCSVVFHPQCQHAAVRIGKGGHVLGNIVPDAAPISRRFTAGGAVPQGFPVEILTLFLREQTYVEAARCIGVKDWKIILRHLLPNTLNVIIVGVTMGIPGAILGESSLSFLGIGVNPPLPSWGRMLNDYLSAVQTHWYLALFPGIMIAITMYAFTLMGDGLQDALDPMAGK